MTPDDLRAAVATCADGLREVADQDWSRPAAGMDWTCSHTAEHLADDLLYYATSLAARATERLTVWGKIEGGATNTPVIAVIEATGELFSVIGDAAPLRPVPSTPWASPTPPATWRSASAGHCCTAMTSAPRSVVHCARPPRSAAGCSTG